jgi:excisionase family DNA binding protein
MPKGKEHKLLTVTEVADRLGAGERSIRNLCRDGTTFPNAMRYGPVWLIPETDLKGFVKRGRGRPKKAQGKKSRSR